jgi:hypothetical protein
MPGFGGAVAAASAPEGRADSEDFDGWPLAAFAFTLDVDDDVARARDADSVLGSAVTGEFIAVADVLAFFAELIGRTLSLKLSLELSLAPSGAPDACSVPAPADAAFTAAFATVPVSPPVVPLVPLAAMFARHDVSVFVIQQLILQHRAEWFNKECVVSFLPLLQARLPWLCRSFISLQTLPYLCRSATFGRRPYQPLPKAFGRRRAKTARQCLGKRFFSREINNLLGLDHVARHGIQTT